MQYAYHIDAAKLADFLAEVCKKRGVKHVRDNVVDVKLDERGYIASLQLQENGNWPIELVVDCTGFRGLLINKALGEPFISYNDHLLNDRAIPMQVRHFDPERIPSVTGAIAMDAGWVWHIPLRRRVGSGYVFCSQFKSDDDALREFREFLGPAGEGLEPQPAIKMRVGRNRRSWVKNCVAIGLSSGFLEPLESTAIMTLELQSRWLLYNMPSTDFEEPLAEQYNSSVNRLYDEIRDFLGLHFSLSERKGPFWDAVRNDAKKSDTLQYHLDAVEIRSPKPIGSTLQNRLQSLERALHSDGEKFLQELQACRIGARAAQRMWQRYGIENRAWKEPILARLAQHKRLIEHVHGQAVPGESVQPKGSFRRETLLRHRDAVDASTDHGAPRTSGSRPPAIGGSWLLLHARGQPRFSMTCCKSTLSGRGQQTGGIARADRSADALGCKTFYFRCFSRVRRHRPRIDSILFKRRASS